jgi:long-chain acyl-CoA synthetase
LLPYRVFRELFFVGASEYFEGRFGRWLARTLNVVPVDPDASLVSAMQASAFGLRRGKVMILFPEGERSIDGTLRPFKKGAAILAHHVEVPVVPVALEGFFEIWPRNRPINWRLLRPWRRARIAVRFGSPIAPDVPASAGSTLIAADAYERTTLRLRGAVEKMWSEIRINSQLPMPNSQEP